MSIFEQIKSMFTGRENTPEPEELSSAEQLLVSNTSWPFKIRGTLSIIDAGSIDENDFPHWTIGEFELENVDGKVLVEFRGDTLRNAGITDEFEYGDPLTLLVNPSFEEYYQVVSIED